MPPSQARSRGGCLTCKSKHKKCDQTKPNCRQCENSGLKCSGYAFITCDSEGKSVKHYARHRSELPTRQRATPVQIRQPSGIVSADPMKGTTTSTPENSFSPIGHRSEDEHKDIGSNTTTHAFDTTCAALHTSFGSTGPVAMVEGYRQNGTHHEVPNNRSSYLVDQLPTAQSTVLYTLAIRSSGHSTTHHSNLMLGRQFHLPPMPNRSCAAAANSGIDPHDSEAMYVKRVIYGSLVLDRTLESNSLSFILESYAAWIQRTAFDPVKVARKAKDYIVKHYGNSTDSRWTITLLANLIGRLAKGRSMDEIRTPSYLTIVSALRKQVCSGIIRSQSYTHPGELGIQDAIMMLDNVVDTTMIFAITGNMDPGLEFMRKAAPLFRRACPDSPSKQIHLQTLFLQPMESLRDYATMDIFSSIITSRPMLFQYDTTIDPELGSSVLNFSHDAGMQWARGLPYQVTLVFARINALRATSSWDLGLFNELETTLQEFVPIPTVSSEPNVVIGKTVVQECWRQAAYIYLYMGLCGAGADDPRVIRALSSFLVVVNSVKPGRVPDSFIILCFVIIGVAARNEDDRSNIRYRMLGVEDFRYRGSCALAMLEQLWKMVDTKSRPAIWTDLKGMC